MSERQHQKSPPQKTLRHRAMDALARREHSRQELRDKLSRRADDDISHLETVLDELGAQGLQSDARFAEAYARSRVRRGYGPVRIRFDLQARGVDKALIESALDELDADWFELAFYALCKRFGTAPPDDFKDKARRGRFLQQRGFSGDTVSAALDRLEQG